MTPGYGIKMDMPHITWKPSLVSLDIATLKHDDLFQRAPSQGVFIWRHPQTDEQLFAVDWLLQRESKLEGQLVLYLKYLLNRDQGQQLAHQRVLVHYLPRLAQWTFVCPGVIQGRPCNRRVGQLYLPAGGREFRCRWCYNR